MFYRSSSAKAKDFFTLYIHQLIVQVWQEQQLCVTNTGKFTAQHSEMLQGVNTTRGLYFDTKSQKVTQYYFSELLDAKKTLSELITKFLLGKQQALLLNGELGEKVFKTNSRSKNKTFEQTDLEKLSMMAKTFSKL